ncbi:hypothetical protein HK101_004053 [Irineochytrium annulatum]|nr:hypothetical protein HK101_004053 [Irineochytrium annulatum]
MVAGNSYQLGGPGSATGSSAGGSHVNIPLVAAAAAAHAQQQQHAIHQHGHGMSSNPYEPAPGPPFHPYNQPAPAPPPGTNAAQPQSVISMDPATAPPVPGKKVDGVAGGPDAVGVQPTSPPNVPALSYALIDDGKVTPRTNLGNTKVVMALLSEMWVFNLFFILGGTFFATFYLGKIQGYDDIVLWDVACYWKMGAFCRLNFITGWLLPLPYCLICFFGLIMPYRTPKFLNFEKEGVKKRRLDNLYILTVTKGSNPEAVYRAWNAHKHLERLHPCVRVHVLTDEPYFFENINCYTCPKSFVAGNSKYKARALEWYRRTMRFTEHDWVLHLDEESVIDDESVRACLKFVWYETDYHFGQGLILYNQYKYWHNWFFTVADAIRVGDDLSRFHLQYTYFHRPIFGAHGSFLLNNGLVENAVSWDLGSLTEDYQFAMKAWDRGFRCGKIPGIIREQSPLDFEGFMKQRRRWYVGIRRLPELLPKIWATFWTLGIFSLYCTILSLILGFLPQFRSLVTPRWYLIGIFVQDLDKGVNPLLMILRIPLTFILQFVAVVLEALAVMYGIAFPPADFDVIKK